MDGNNVTVLKPCKMSVVTWVLAPEINVFLGFCDLFVFDNVLGHFVTVDI